MVVREAAKTPRSAPAEVIWLQYSIEDETALPDGFVSVDAVVNEFEGDAAGRVAMLEARQFVGEELYKDQLPRLATYRLAKGWSQKRLAEELGTSQSHVARLETGRSDPQMSTVRRICTVLGITIQDFEDALDAKAKTG